MNRNILLLGSSCVGKTSVFDLLKEDPILKEKYDFIDSLSRKIRRDEEITSFDDIVFQRKLYQAYSELIDKKELYCSDRSVLDVFTFTETFKENSMELMVLLSDMSDFIHANRSYFNECLIFYFPIYWKVEDDGERLVDQERRNLWDKCIKETLNNEGIDSFIVPFASPKERVQFIHNILWSAKNC